VFRPLPVLLLCAASFSTASATPPGTPRSPSFTPGVLLVATDEAGALSADRAGRLQAADPLAARACASLGIDRARPLGPVRAAGVGPAPRFLELRSTRASFDPLEAARALRATGAFRAVCPDYRLAPFGTRPDDTDFPFQWYADSGAIGIQLPDAWDLERGDSSVVIAIMDTGIDTGHPDLASKIWHNPGEIPGNGLDDDGNGLVDDVEGWDFGTDDADPNPEYTQDVTSGLDVGFHGTFCAGLAAAATGNAEGIAGAAWRCRLMPLKVSHPDSGITTRAVTEAFLYAADRRPGVLSMSFGAAGDPGVPEYFQALVDVATAAGVLCVAAAGNDGDSARVYPAACNGVLAVAATDLDNARAYFSQWGPWVDVAAPGSLMWSTICRNYVFSDLDQLYYWFLFGWDGERPYMYGDGTSFACPLVAGVCGLVRSRFAMLTPQQVIEHLVATGDSVSFDYPIGPKVNAFRAVETPPAAVTPPALPLALRLEPPAPNPSGRAADLRFGLPAGGRAQLTIFDCAGRRVRTLVDAMLPAGSHFIRWDGRDGAGRAAPSGVYLVRLECNGAAAGRKLVRLGP
jgi:subtilisin family serine protease